MHIRGWKGVLFLAMFLVMGKGAAGESGSAPPPSATIIPPGLRVAVPAFEPLTGLQAGAGLSVEDLRGRICVVNIWYEY